MLFAKKKIDFAKENYETLLLYGLSKCFTVHPLMFFILSFVLIVMKTGFERV